MKKKVKSDKAQEIKTAITHANALRKYFEDTIIEEIKDPEVTFNNSEHMDDLGSIKKILQTLDDDLGDVEFDNLNNF